MFLINTKQLSVMRDRFNDLLPDKCTLGIRTNSLDSAGQPIASWDTTTYTNIPCGFETSPFKFRAREIVAGGEGTSEILVRARLPIAYYDVLDQEDRIILTKRHGDTLTSPETYEIQGFLERGPVGLIANLKRVEP